MKLFKFIVILLASLFVTASVYAQDLATKTDVDVLNAVKADKAAVDIKADIVHVLTVETKAIEADTKAKAAADKAVIADVKATNAEIEAKAAKAAVDSMAGGLPALTEALNIVEHRVRNMGIVSKVGAIEAAKLYEGQPLKDKVETLGSIYGLMKALKGYHKHQGASIIGKGTIFDDKTAKEMEDFLLGFDNAVGGIANRVMDLFGKNLKETAIKYEDYSSKPGSSKYFSTDKDPGLAAIVEAVTDFDFHKLIIIELVKKFFGEDKWMLFPELERDELVNELSAKVKNEIDRVSIKDFRYTILHRAFEKSFYGFNEKLLFGGRFYDPKKEEMKKAAEAAAASTTAAAAAAAIGAPVTAGQLQLQQNADNALLEQAIIDAESTNSTAPEAVLP